MKMTGKKKKNEEEEKEEQDEKEVIQKKKKKKMEGKMKKEKKKKEKKKEKGEGRAKRSRRRRKRRKRMMRKKRRRRRRRATTTRKREIQTYKIKIKQETKKVYHRYSLSPMMASTIVAITAAPITKKSNLWTWHACFVNYLLNYMPLQQLNDRYTQHIAKKQNSKNNNKMQNLHVVMTSWMA